MPIAFEGCRFGYSRRKAIFSSLDIGFPEGTTALLGPNGAGKSTLLGLAASFYTPASGEVSYRGIRSSRSRDQRRYRQLIGWMPQSVTAIPGFTVREQVAYTGWLKGMTRHDAWTESIEALRLVGLSKLLDQRASAVSGGQLRRVGLAQTLVHRAEVILMDEPTAGLDPLQHKRFSSLIAELANRAHVIVSTHQVVDVSAMYSSVIVLDEGTVRFEGSTARFLDLAHTAGSPEGGAHAAFANLIAEED